MTTTTAEKPKLLEVRPDGIPDELKRTPQWVTWRLEPKGDGWTKVPYQVNGQHARVDSAETWTTFDAALAAYRSGDADGVGFVFSADDPYVGIDLDHIDSPELKTSAESFLRLLNSYTELSPSGTGYRVIARGTLPEGRRRSGNVEMYDRGRYFTVTGHRVEHSPATPEPREALIEALYAKYFADESAPTPSTATHVLTISDDDAIAHVNATDKGHALWDGDTTAYKSESEADLALCRLIERFVGGDAAMIERIWLASGLGVRVKAKRADYRKRTIDTVLATPSAQGVGGSDVWAVLRRIDFDAPMEPAAAVIAALLRERTVTAVAADDGMGKSFFLQGAAMHIRNGRPFVDREVMQGAVLLLDGQLADVDLRDRLRAIGGEAPLPIVCSPLDLDLTTERGRKLLLAAGERAEDETSMPLRLLAVDSCLEFIGDRSPNETPTVTAFHHTLRAARDAFPKAALAFTMNLRKFAPNAGPANSTKQRAANLKRWTDMCDEVLDVRADKDEAHRYIERLTVTPNKNRHALNKALTLDLQRGGERLTFAVPDPNVFLIGAPRKGGRPKRVTDEDVLAALADGPVTHDDLREKLDVSRGTLRQRLKSLEEAGRAFIDRSKKPHAISAVERP